MSITLDELSNTPLDLVHDANSVSLLETDIINEIQRRVDISETKWTGCMGIIRKCAVVIRIFLPCCPIVCWVQQLVLGGRYTP